MFIFINRRRYIRIIDINNNRIFLYILYTYSKFIYFINKIKSIKYLFIYNR